LVRPRGTAIALREEDIWRPDGGQLQEGADGRRPENELWGDGILSAIDCKVTLEKKGERGVITIDAKFLHYKEF
jgi:hypothetical protein